jgi:uncharacterized protein YkwD
MKNLVKKTIYILIFATIINIASLSSVYATISTTDLVGLTNASRSQNNLSSLSINSKLQLAAEAKAKDMFTNQYFSHNSPTGKTPWDFIDAADYNYIYAGENLSIGYTDNTELHNAWMNSPTHRENILSPNFREIGMATLTGDYEGANTTIVVQMFGSTNLTQATTANTPPSTGNTININKSESKVTPTKIFSGDQIELHAVTDKPANEIYFMIGDQKIDLTDSIVSGSTYVYDKNFNFDKTGTLPVVLYAIDSSGNRSSESLGELNVVPKLLFGATSQINGNNNSINTILIVSAGTLIILAFAGYFIFKNKKSHKLTFKFN